MSEPSVPAVDSPEEEPRRSRSTAIAAVACVLLALPFLVLGPYLLDVKARLELRCEPGGPCTLSRAGWLTGEQVARFTLEEIQGVTVERSRSARRNSVPIFRPELLTAQGKFPLFHQWATEEAEATRVAEQVQRYLAAPREAPLEVVRDDRRASLRVGGAFSGAGLLLLAFSAWLAVRTRAHRRAERAASA
ncbi:hypothetical protein [Pyxidicoccus xibeiensis]|uniref:hypothetical protein n=1 Tax=Pyxidicoccus xibeiensis TaxID=2906759 RepID=UPI0020A6F18C|nr:hypothetical protein [Pyxidicoccus xibeiensis]MCP3137042.1 hypothetical protein [Pyxidicoccus xibeiensis]